ncbi:MAG: TonB-dependent receptor [Acidobacteria bacterium]|nr:TonB-dependent receptor [Acidobacteriota bacterium]
MSRSTLSLALASVFLACSLPTSAQVLYGSLIGDVTDPTSAVIAGAQVTITNRETGYTRESSSDSNGRYTFQNVNAGTYDVKISAPGFQTTSRAGIVISINNIARLDLSLKVGDVTDQVTVEATTAQLQTDKSDVHVEIGSKEVTNIPLPRYRNYQSLINLVPGATPGRYQNSAGSTPGRSLTTSVNGVNRNNNVTKLDGAVNTNIWLPHHTAYVAPAETIETVNISTNSFDAEQGMAGGAATTVVTKSGTNSLHGSGFAFHENSAWGARNVFFKDPKLPKSLVTIDGGTLGGPIIKNKLFFFGSYEGTRERLNRSKLLTVPTASQRAGDFSASATTIYDPQTGDAAGNNRTPFAGNRIPTNRQSRVTQQLYGLLPAPNLSGITNNFFATGPQNLTRDNYDAKINWNRSASNSWFFKYAAMDALVIGRPAFGAAGGACSCDSGIGDAGQLVQLATVGQTYTISPTFLWDMTMGWTRTGANSIPTGYGTNTGLDVLKIPGTNGASIRESGMPNFQIANYADLGLPETWNPYFYGDTTYTMTQNFSLVKGKHDIRFGFEGVRHWLNHYQPELGAGPRGRFNFSQATTGTRLPNATGALTATPTNQFNSQAAFYLGLPTSVSKSLQWSKMTSFNYQLGFFVRDRWQVSRKLTVSMGVRYELYPMMTRSGYGGIEQWDEKTNLVQLGGRGSNPTDLGISTSKKLFAPRFGFAYRLGDNTVIRSGYGLTYNPMPFARPLRGFYPLTVAQEFVSASAYIPYGTTEQGIPAFSGPDLSQSAVALPATAQMRTISGDSVTRGYVQSWNLFVERKLPGAILASVGYVGTNTIRSFIDWDANAAAAGAGNTGRPFYAAFGRTATTWYWNGQANTNYNGLQMSATRNAGKGLLLKAAYTFSKAINVSDDDGWAQYIFMTPSQLSRNRARSGYDTPHNFQLGFVYDVPFGKNGFGGPIAGAIIRGWQMNGIFAAYSGRPFTVTADGGALNAPGNTQTADQVKTTVTQVGTTGEYYDRTAFAGVTATRFGTSGRNLLRGPRIINLDFGLFRNIKLTERVNLQFRAEAFNLSNTPHFNNPSANVNAGDFMQITSALDDQRSMRFGLRVQF